MSFSNINNPNKISKNFKEELSEKDELYIKLNDKFEKGLITENNYLYIAEQLNLIKGGKRAEVGERREFTGLGWYVKQPKGSKYPWVKESSLNKKEDKTEHSTGAIPKTAEEHARSTSTAKLEAYLTRSDADPTYKKIIEAELKKRKEWEIANKNPFDIEIDETEENTNTNLSVDQQWTAYGVFAELVIDGTAKSLISYGTGGVGKTYTIQQILDKKNMIAYDEERFSKGDSGYDYVVIKGKASPIAAYRALYEHNGKLIIYDDCDAVLNDPDAIDTFKGALDTESNTIEWDSSKKIIGSDGEEIPKRFKFKGRVIFVTNRPAKEFGVDKNGKLGDLQPIASRSLSIDLTMTKDETIARVKDIIPNVILKDSNFQPILDVTMKDKKLIVDFFEEHKVEIPIDKFNMRTFGSAIKVIKRSQALGKDWKPNVAPLLGIKEWKSDLTKSEIDLFLKGIEIEEKLESELNKIIKGKEFSKNKREKLSKEGEAESDGSYPIENEGDLKNAIRAIGRSKDYDKTKAWIKKRAKELDKESLLPEDWKQEEQK